MTWLLAFGGGFLQLGLAYFGPLVVAMVLELALGAKDSVAWLVFDYVIFWFLSISAALSVFRLMPEAAESGRWVWAVPVALLASGVVWDMHLGIFNTARAVFWGRGEDGWVRALVTLPAWSCCWYSGTMTWRRRRRNRSLVGATIAV
jgi:hypothetical protein